MEIAAILLNLFNGSNCEIFSLNYDEDPCFTPIGHPVFKITLFIAVLRAESLNSFQGQASHSVPSGRHRQAQATERSESPQCGTISKPGTRIFSFD
jgi:hypothetical protein